MKKIINTILVITVILSVLTACASGGTNTDNTSSDTTKSENSSDEAATGQEEASDEVVEIEFFEYKTEAIGIFEELANEFMEDNPNIKITVSSPPEAGTVIKTRVASGDIPDIVAVGADNTYSDLAAAGVFKNLSGASQLDLVHDAYLQTIKDVSKLDDLYAIPYVANADAVIYNKTIFADLGIEVPKTWDDFIAAAETAKAADITPFYFTFKDAWTTLPAFNVFAANTTDPDFFKQLDAGETTYSEGYREAMEMLLQIVDYGHGDNMGKTYADGNTAFANGESAMLLQGIWAINEIKKANPDIELGIFPYPVGSPAKVVSGVDLLFSISEKSENQEEAMMWIDFLMQKDVAKRFIDNQRLFSAVKGVDQEAPELEGVKEPFANGHVIDFPDHYIPSSMDLANLLQEFVVSGDIEASLEQMDVAWEAYQLRQQ